MVGAGRPKTPLDLSAAERAALTDLATHDHASVALRLRSRIVLACADGRTNKEVADALRITPATVGKWRRRFLMMGLAGLDDSARSGRPRRSDGTRLALLRTPPANGRPATTRQLARTVGVSQSTAARRQRELRQHSAVRRGTATMIIPSMITEPPRIRPSEPGQALLSDRVYETIRGWILSGELAPGTRVVESEIARVLGTSQSPAREAVRRLAHEGLVTHRPRLGNFVTVISQVEAREAREVRVLLETASARRAAGHLTPEELAALRSEVGRMRAAAGRRDIGAFREADMRFHGRVCASSGNSMLLRMWRIWEATWWNLQVVSNAMYAGDWHEMALRHEDLVVALERGDPHEAARLFSAHARGESSITRPTQERSHG